MNHNQTVGIAFVLAFNLLAAAKDVYSAHLLQSLSPWVVTFTIFLIAVAVFTALAWKKRKIKPNKESAAWRDVALINLSTLGSFLGFFYALKYLEPAIVDTVTMSMGPLFTVVLARQIRPGSSVSRIDIALAAGMFASVLFLFYESLRGHSAVGSIEVVPALISVLCVAVSGISMSFNSLFAKRMFEAGWSIEEIMAKRFTLLLALSGVFIFVLDCDIGSILSNFWEIALIAVFGTIIPLYLLNKGIEKADPVAVAFVLSLSAVFTYAFQGFDTRLSLSVPSIVGISIISILSICGAVLKCLKKAN